MSTAAKLVAMNSNNDNSCAAIYVKIINAILEAMGLIKDAAAKLDALGNRV